MKLCKLAPGPMLGGLEQLLQPLQKTVEKVPKDTLPQNDIERMLELRKSALRVLVQFQQLENINSCVGFKDLMALVGKNSSWVATMEQLKQEATL